MVLLHGMVAGNSFGAAYDALAEHATLVVPDLLGFGVGGQARLEELHRFPERTHPRHRMVLGADILAGAGIPVTLAVGATDPVPVPGRAAELARTWPSIRHLLRPHADHGRPSPSWSVVAG